MKSEKSLKKKVTENYTISVKFQYESKEYSYLYGKFKNEKEAEKYREIHNCGGVIKKLEKGDEPKDLEGNIIAR